jgi:hypothetical protein
MTHFTRPQPITESEHSALLFDSYVTYIHRHDCVACGSTETFSQCFELWVHPTKTQLSSLRDLRPVTGAPDLTQVSMAVLNAPRKKIPVCHECVVRQAGPRVVIPASNAAWQETLRRKYTSDQQEPKVAVKSTSPATKAVPRLDQI